MSPYQRIFAYTCPTLRQTRIKPLNADYAYQPNDAGVAACREWYATQAGQSALASVQRTVAEMSAGVFGYFALEEGVLAGYCPLLQESRIASQFSLGMVAGERASLISLPEQLPITADNVDLVVAAHVLDCAAEPHQVLREIDRVLVPEGHCILIGFNPFSFRGFGQWRYWANRGEPPFRLYTAFRVRDWLSVLGFEVLQTVTVGFRPAMGGDYLFQRSGWLERLGNRYHFATGSVYIIHAQRKVSNMKLLRPSLKPASVLRPGIVASRGAGHVSSHGQKPAG